MSTSIKLEPATDGTGGDPPVGVFNPAHAVEFLWQPLTMGVGVLCVLRDGLFGGEGWGVSEAFKLSASPTWGESVAEKLELVRWLWVATQPLIPVRTGTRGPFWRDPGFKWDGWMDGKKFAKISYLWSTTGTSF